MDNLLLCCDLDRTVIPNGEQTESVSARALFHKLTAQDQVTLAYVSGRDKSLLRSAIERYQLPIPNFAIGDVGTTIYSIEQHKWQPLLSWQDHIAPDWNNYTRDQLVEIIGAIAELTLQEPNKQNQYKLSYYATLNTDSTALLAKVQQRLDPYGINANLIWSIDAAKQVGLLDILPASADKLHAIRFLMQNQGIDNNHIVFAGDSGNDLAVLCSEIPAVLVKNAQQSIKTEATQLAKRYHHDAQLYIAQGNFLGMNGNYSAGILEGVVHYHPPALSWITT